jgi:hypothetical protein
MWPCKNISGIQVLVINFFPTLPIKLKLGLQVGGRLLLATHLDQSNYLANQKQGAVNKYDLIVFITLFRGSSRAWEVWCYFQWIHWIWLINLIQVHGRTLSIGEDALTLGINTGSKDPTCLEWAEAILVLSLYEHDTDLR